MWNFFHTTTVTAYPPIWPRLKTIRFTSTFSIMTMSKKKIKKQCNKFKNKKKHQKISLMTKKNLISFNLTYKTNSKSIFLAQYFVVLFLFKIPFFLSRIPLNLSECNALNPFKFSSDKLSREHPMIKRKKTIKTQNKSNRTFFIIKKIV